MGPCHVFTYYKNIYCSINPSEDVENLGRNTLVFESDWNKLPHLRKVAKSLIFSILPVLPPVRHGLRATPHRAMVAGRTASRRSVLPREAGSPADRSSAATARRPAAARPGICATL